MAKTSRAQINRWVQEALQFAEEIGGPENDRDYIELMEAISAEAMKRAGRAAAKRTKR